MSPVDDVRVSRDRKTVEHLEGPLGAAQDALLEAESALAMVMLEMAEAGCKGVPRPERRMRAVQLAYLNAVENLNDQIFALQSGSRRGSIRAGVKSVRDPK